MESGQLGILIHKGEKLRHREGDDCLMAKDGTSFAPGLVLRTSKALPLSPHDKPESKTPLSLSCDRWRNRGTQKLREPQ